MQGTDLLLQISKVLKVRYLRYLKLTDQNEGRLDDY